MTNQEVVDFVRQRIASKVAPEQVSFLEIPLVCVHMFILKGVAQG